VTEGKEVHLIRRVVKEYDDEDHEQGANCEAGWTDGA